MALGHCPDCKEEMSDSADSCPHCGSTSRPVEYRWKKKTKKWKSKCSECEGTGELYRIEVEERTKKVGHLFWSRWYAHSLMKERGSDWDAIFKKSQLDYMCAIEGFNTSGSERAPYDKDDPYAFREYQERFSRVIKFTCPHCEGSGEVEHTEVERNMYEEEL